MRMLSDRRRTEALTMRPISKRIAVITLLKKLLLDADTKNGKIGLNYQNLTSL